MILGGLYHQGFSSLMPILTRRSLTALTECNLGGSLVDVDGDVDVIDADH